MRSASGKVSCLSGPLFITLKLAVLAPMPRASAATAEMLKPEFCHNYRTPKRTSCPSNSSLMPAQLSRSACLTCSIPPKSHSALA